MDIYLISCVKPAQVDWLQAVQEVLPFAIDERAEKGQEVDQAENERIQDPCRYHHSPRLAETLSSGQSLACFFARLLLSLHP